MVQDRLVGEFLTVKKQERRKIDMAKFDFLASGYAKLWDSEEGRLLLTQILGDPELVKMNNTFWATEFTVDANPIPTPADGLASFTVSAKEPETSELMDMRAPLGGSLVGDTKGSTSYSGSIGDFIAKGYRESSLERAYKEKMYEKYGDQAVLIAEYAQRVLQPRVDSANMTLTNMAVQALTTGKVSANFGKGTRGTLYTAPIPTANKVKAGPVVWTDPQANILDCMRDIELKAQETAWGRGIAAKWEMDYDFFHNVVVKNAQVAKAIKAGWLADKGQTMSNVDYAPDTVLTAENFNKYVAGLWEGISPVKVVRAWGRDGGSLVNPWPDGVVALCPQGYAGRVLRTDILDEQIYGRYGNKACTFAFQRTRNGLFLVMNSVIPNGSLQEYHTDVMMSAVPVLEDFMYRILVDTKTANS